MAHDIQPMHRPHDQLRTEPAAQRQHNDKYFTAFTSGENTVDVQFRNAILPKSSSHYKVGVDELTVNLGQLSMLAMNATSPETVFRVIRRGNDGVQDPDWRMHGVPGNDNYYRKGFEFVVDRVYNSIQDVIDRLGEIENSINHYVNNVVMTFANGFQYHDAARTGANPAGQSYVGTGAQLIRFKIDRRGNFRIEARSDFYAHFVIEFPLKKYRQIFFGNTTQRFVWAHPTTGIFYKPGVNDDYRPYDIAANGALTTRAPPDVGGTPYDINNYVTDQAQGRETVFKGDPSVFHTLDRRVTIEVGCSLPLMNSPFVDHGKEAPDYVLGRYMFHRPYTIESQDAGAYSIHAHGVGTLQLQGPKDRVCYHQLRPQQKVQQIRLKLWMRVREFDDDKETWGMTTLVCPVEKSDYWQIKLHFKEKGSAY